MKKEKNSSNKCPICGRPTHKESKYCIFHASAEEKTEEEFKRALKKYIQEIKEGDKDYNFERFIFIGDINFKKDMRTNIFIDAKFGKTTFEGIVRFESITFKGNTNFEDANFKGYADFCHTKFEGKAIFERATFERYVDFMNVKFNGRSLFTEAIFKIEANFWGARFEKSSIFFLTTFKEKALFMNAIFKFSPFFTEANFKGRTDFHNVIFKKGAYFRRATFEEDVSFNIKNLIGRLDFEKIYVLPGNKISIRIEHCKGEINFQYAYLENAFLEFKLSKDILINFSNTLLRNTKIKKVQIANHIIQEHNKEFYIAKEIFLILKNNFHSIGMYEDESWAFVKEKDMERKSNIIYSLLNEKNKYDAYKEILRQSNLSKIAIIKSKIFFQWLFSKAFIKWSTLTISNFIYQYGENPWRVIRFALIIIFSFALILNFSGIVNSDRTNLIIEFIKESQSDEYNLRYLGPILGNFLNCLYFSVVTFTTLGYGDFQPAVGLSRFFVSLESIIGAFTMALFVYTFARRTGGR